mmetsp:Transcript_156400/g.299937  ORF Transcript_156400/g.299937 Transcript_156400/m.299937 type:complete len:286 (-) Transcript_156400:46-903(-)
MTAACGDGGSGSDVGSPATSSSGQDAEPATGGATVRKPFNIATGLRGLDCFKYQPKAESAPKSGLHTFLQRRRAAGTVGESKPASLKTFDLLREWRDLPADEKEQYDQEAREQRSAGSTASGIKGRLQEQGQAARAVKPLDPNADPLKPRGKRKHETPKAEVRRPVFPRRATAAGAAECREDRRREMADTIKVRAEGSAARVAISSSHGVSLAEVSASLSAPRLSCDWEAAAAATIWADGESEHNDAHGLLTVDLPDDGRARDFLQQELRREISSAQVRSLAERA